MERFIYLLYVLYVCNSNGVSNSRIYVYQMLCLGIIYTFHAFFCLLLLYFSPPLLCISIIQNMIYQKPSMKRNEPPPFPFPFPLPPKPTFLCHSILLSQQTGLFIPNHTRNLTIQTSRAHKLPHLYIRDEFPKHSRFPIALYDDDARALLERYGDEGPGFVHGHLSGVDAAGGE